MSENAVGEKRIRVGLIFGGKSGEHQVSLASAHSVVSAIDSIKYDVVQIGITPDGNWVVGDLTLKQLAAASPSPLLPSVSLALLEGQRPERVIQSKALVPKGPVSGSNGSPLATLDVAFPLLHGPFGEDGTVQGLLELADIPYVGAGVAASAVGMDKALMKSVFRSQGLPVVDWIVVLRREWETHPEEVLSRVERDFGYPCFVKPVNLGSSVGISKAHDRAECIQGLDAAAQYDRKLIVERSVQNAREIECSVLGNDEPLASLPGEIIPKREFYDYAAKYRGETGTELIVPANLTPETTEHVQDMAKQAFRAIDCCGMARVDFFVERETNRVLLNEINTIPGFTSVSMYPRMWEKSGLSYPDLIHRLIQLALERHADKRRSKTAYDLG